MNTAAILRSLTTSTSRYEERADGVIVQRLLTTRTQTLMDARENTVAFVRMAGGIPRRVLLDLRITRAMQPGVREHYVDSELAKWCTAVALLAATPSSHQLCRYYLEMNRQGSNLPMMLFTDEPEAIGWLHLVTSDQPTFAGNAAL
ncbi:hypothetical protein [Nannocystis sp. SCPEA4]|jgi:hypothetical protein|uniref:DUF7793 family protein n=1 Tax=Nannocystis sp. SCPEA4 TaxID=2996787 RepID=UPI00226D9D89|nr:hypothetical protein [Nannocystis sp. SCPEA4]MCY1056615.1 hypothetical protein [Nannocystis sp. SCPEA4]